MSFTETISLFGVLLAFLGAFLAFIALRKQIATEAITQNRILWIVAMRDLLAEFIAECETTNRKDQKIRLQAKIRLYIHPYNNTYRALERCIDECLLDAQKNDDESDSKQYHENIEKLVTASRHVINSAWIRMKREAGISYHNENKLIRSIWAVMPLQKNTYRPLDRSNTPDNWVQVNPEKRRLDAVEFLREFSNYTPNY